MNTFQKAVKSQAKLRLALDGPSGSGKTYTALLAATAMAKGGKIAVIDTERGSASLYADKFSFDVATLESFSPLNYVGLIEAAEEAGYAVIVIDSLSHAWEGEGGALDMVDDAQKRQKVANSFTAWKDITPIHRKLVDAMLQSRCHIIATMRSKTEYVLEAVERNGRTVQVPKKIGMAPIQRQGMEYEFTIVGDLDLEHTLVISKSRMSELADAVEQRPGARFFEKILTWLETGAAEQPKQAAATFQPPTPPAEGNNGKAEQKAPAKPTNSQKAKAAVQNPTIVFEQALEFKTSKGTPLYKCSNDQLVMIIEKSTDSVLKQGAQVILDSLKSDSMVGTDQWDAFGKLMNRAEAAGLDMAPFEPPSGASLGDLCKSWKAVAALLAA